MRDPAQGTDKHAGPTAMTSEAALRVAVRCAAMRVPACPSKDFSRGAALTWCIVQLSCFHKTRDESMDLRKVRIHQEDSGP